MKKHLIAIGLCLLSLSFAFVICVFEINAWPAGSSIAGIAIGFSIPAAFHAVQNLLDRNNWQVSQRMLKRGGFIKDDTIIRISFAYLYRIKVDNKYLLVKNARGTQKYQPVGGVYKFTEGEKIILKNLFQVKDDDKVSLDESSKDDYRLRLESRYLRRFVRRFDKKADRERLDNLGRELSEELTKTGLLDWKTITYRFCGRHISELKFGEHFQIYELLLADVVELMPTEDQMSDLRRLMKQSCSRYRFATAEEIRTLGIDTGRGKLAETIADHTKKTIQENDGELMKIRGYGGIYTIDLPR